MSDPSAIDFSGVLDAELVKIDERRESFSKKISQPLLADAPNREEKQAELSDDQRTPRPTTKPDGSVDAAQAREALTDDPQAQDEKLKTQRKDSLEVRALKMDLCGLAISGGGIRSATFALGVIQGLAITGLLRRFDYLSTVSGGGYIGAWWSAWIRCAGFDQVEEQLLPPHLRQGDFSEIEARPIRHLRLYSNYLAPRPTIFSFDGWSLIAIYLRNLFLNQLVLLLATLSLLAFCRGIVEFYPIAYTVPVVTTILYFGDSLAVLTLLIAVFGCNRYAPHFDGVCWAKRFWLNRFWVFCVAPWLLAAFILSLHFMLLERLLAMHVLNFSDVLIRISVNFACIYALLGFVATSKRWSGLFVGGFAGAFSGALLAAFMSIVQWFSSIYGIPVALTTVLGFPICLLGFLLAQYLMVGLCGPGLREIEREWWSSLGSRLLAASVAWFLLFFATIFGPWIVVGGLRYAFSEGGLWSKIATGAIGTTWIGALLSGIGAAASSATAWGKVGIRESLARVAPVMFLITIFVGCAVLMNWIAYDVYAALTSLHGEDWFFWRRPDLMDYLTDLNEAKPLWAVGSGFAKLPMAWLVLLLASGALFLCSKILGNVVGINTFTLHSLYANRLVRCYLGATNKARRPNPVVNMDPGDDIELCTLFSGAKYHESAANEIGDDAPSPQNTRGPIHLINGALNRNASSIHHAKIDHQYSSSAKGAEAIAEDLQFLERQAESFVFTPQFCGSRSTGYVPTHEFADSVKIGAAVAVSGAAVSPNMGYHSSPSITALLTVFNVRLGAWFGNPMAAKTVWQNPNPAASASLLMSELMGATDAKGDYIYISDGGHFENMGVYELIRRRCRFIVAVDAGADPKFHENVGRLVRQVRIDFGIWLEIDMTNSTPGANGLCKSHVVVGRIHYEDIARPKNLAGYKDPKFDYSRGQGIIIWIKNSLTGDEPGDLVNHAAMHPTFPYDTTVDQFFSEPQFESYRALGVHTVLSSLIYPTDDILRCSSQSSSHSAAHGSAELGALKDKDVRDLFAAVYQHWLETPREYIGAYLLGNEAYARIQASLRTDANLQQIASEIYGGSAPMPRTNANVSIPERHIAIEMYTLLENVYLALNLELNYQHPVHCGWMEVFKNWTGSPTLKAVWSQVSGEFSPSFRRFIDAVTQQAIADAMFRMGANSHLKELQSESGQRST